MALAELPSVSVPRRTTRPQAVVVWLRGEHDFFTMPGLWGTMAQAIAFDDGDVVVDLSEVDFMDASTISVLVRARTMLATRSRSLTLRAPSNTAVRILDLCGVAATA